MEPTDGEVAPKEHDALPEMPFPSKGDHLIDPSVEWWGRGTFGPDRHGLDEYSSGYKQAADILATRVISAGRDTERLILPIMFLYRHYLELRLKELNTTGHELLSKKGELPGGHSLMNLWAEARRILEEVWPAGSKKELHAMDVIIREFDKIDPEGVAFRYPTNSNGLSTLDSLRHLDLPKTCEVIGKAANLLDSASAGIGEYLSNKREVERGFENEHG